MPDLLLWAGSHMNFDVWISRYEFQSAPAISLFLVTTIIHYACTVLWESVFTCWYLWVCKLIRWPSTCSSWPPLCLPASLSPGATGMGRDQSRATTCWWCMKGMCLVGLQLLLLWIVVAHVSSSWVWWGGWLERITSQWRKAILQPTSVEKCTTVSVE